MKCEIRNEQKLHKLNRKLIRRLINFLASKFSISSNYIISLYFVDNYKIKIFNKKYLSHDYATDVLAFPMNENNILGDIVISIEQALIQMKQYKIEDEILFLIIHGFLHLIGFEDYSDDSKKRMLDLGNKLLKDFRELDED